LFNNTYTDSESCCPRCSSYFASLRIFVVVRPLPAVIYPHFLLLASVGSIAFNKSSRTPVLQFNRFHLRKVSLQANAHRTCYTRSDLTMPLHADFLKPLPWLSPPPESQIQSSLVVELKWFNAPQVMPDDYPFRLNPDKPLIVPFFEWHGRGSPPDDIGYPGDVYLDLTPDHLGLYAYTTDKWVTSHRNGEAHCSSPLSRGTFLRCPEISVGWFAITTIVDKRFHPQTHFASEAIRTIIGHKRKGPEQNVTKRKHREHEEDCIRVEPQHKKKHGLANTDKTRSHRSYFHHPTFIFASHERCL